MKLKLPKRVSKQFLINDFKYIVLETHTTQAASRGSFEFPLLAG
jgi:hypothetical protein